MTLCYVLVDMRMTGGVHRRRAEIVELCPTRSPVRQRSGLMVTEEWLGKTTGGYPATTGTDPETKAEWNNSVALRPPLVCTGRG